MRLAHDSPRVTDVGLPQAALPHIKMRVRPEGRSQEVRVTVIYKLFEPKLLWAHRVSVTSTESRLKTSLRLSPTRNTAVA